MWSYGKRLSAADYHWGNIYTPIENEWIEDDIYAELAAAADALYNLQKEMSTQAEMQRLAQVDAYVHNHGTTEADQMLGEIFKNKR